MGTRVILRTSKGARKKRPEKGKNNAPKTELSNQVSLCLLALCRITSEFQKIVFEIGKPRQHPICRDPDCCLIGY